MCALFCNGSETDCKLIYFGFLCAELDLFKNYETCKLKWNPREIFFVFIDFSSAELSFLLY